MKYLSTIFIAVAGMSTAVLGQDATVNDLNALVGKQVIVQRTPLCQPGTFETNLSYAGKQATVVSLKPFKMPKMNTSRLTPELRTKIEDAQHMATILVKFEDGTQLDSCSPVLPSLLSNYFELVPGQKAESPIAPVAAATSSHTPLLAPAISSQPVAPVASRQECPVAVTKATSTDGGFRHALADALTKSDFERAVERAEQGGHDAHYLDVRMRNDSGKEVRGIEAFAVYLNIMGDQSATTSILSQNDKPIKPGGEYKGYSIDTYERSSNGKGDVTVYVNRVRFDDDTFWYDNGSHSCALATRIRQ